MLAVDSRLTRNSHRHQSPSEHSCKKSNRTGHRYYYNQSPAGFRPRHLILTIVTVLHRDHSCRPTSMSNKATLVSLAWQAAYCLAAPTLNTTAAGVNVTPATPVADPGWKKEPKGRGTFSIILTSVLTLGLCVWTAIHPNVKPSATAWQKVKHRLWFVIVGMLAPEVVLVVAFYEWQEARKFHREWCDLYDIVPNSTEDTLRMKGAFFVTMGGVSFLPAYKVPANFRNILSTEAYLELARTKTTGEVLGQREFKELMKHTGNAVVEATKTEDAVELFELDSGRSEPEGGFVSTLTTPVSRNQPEGPEVEMLIKREFVHYREVQDKGKAEVLGKTMVCLQALWMLVQCIVRKASGLPVTLLEIHVAMHVICAVGMYAFWFNKPQDVGEPITVPGIITGTSDQMQLYAESIHQNTGYYQGRSLKIELHDSRGDQSYIDRRYPTHRPQPTTNSVHFLGRLARWREQVLEQRGLRPAESSVADPTRLIVPQNHLLDLGVVTVHHGSGSRMNCVMPSEDLDFLKEAAKAWEAGKRSKWPRVKLLKHVSVLNAGDILGQISVSNVSSAILILLLYGACHAAAWNTHFPSPVERLLWRISSCVMAVVPSYALFLIALGNGNYKILLNVSTLYFAFILEFLDDHDWDGTYLLFILPPLIATITAVLLGRLYLFVESFLSLRSLPYGSFDSTPWEDYFPHF